MSRPPRKAIPYWVKRFICSRQDGYCSCGCKHIISPESKSDTDFQHYPPLALREINADGTDYLPPQLDPDYIFAMRSECHDRQTWHPRSKATVLGSDSHALTKARRLERQRLGIAKKKRGRKITSRGFDKTKTRGFDGKIRERK